MSLRQLVRTLSFSIYIATLALAEDATPSTVQSTTVARPSSLEEVSLGRPIQSEGIKYPKRAFKNKVQGTVVLKLTVGKDGKVTHAEPLSGDSELAESAVRSVLKWSYVPYYRDLDPVEVQTTVSINFAIDESGKQNITAAFKDRQSPPISAKPGTGITPPKLIYGPDPDYSKDAQDAKHEGVCVLALIVGTDGYPRDIKVLRPLGVGLDEKAIEAVQRWRFQPARKNGVPVSVSINVEVRFRLR